MMTISQLKLDELYKIHAKFLVAGTGGLGCLQCKAVIILRSSVRQLLSKLCEIVSLIVADATAGDTNLH